RGAEVVRRMRHRGVILGGRGERSVRLRPMLVFGEGHADVFVEELEGVCRDVGSGRGEGSKNAPLPS
ncbi:hypothetical protein HK097_006246, partial [Rhizophlyctis rosea]